MTHLLRQSVPGDNEHQPLSQSFNIIPTETSRYYNGKQMRCQFLLTFQEAPILIIEACKRSHKTAALHLLPKLRHFWLSQRLKSNQTDSEVLPYSKPTPTEAAPASTPPPLLGIATNLYQWQLFLYDGSMEATQHYGHYQVRGAAASNVLHSVNECFLASEPFQVWQRDRNYSYMDADLKKMMAVVYALLRWR